MHHLKVKLRLSAPPVCEAIEALLQVQYPAQRLVIRAYDLSGSFQIKIELQDRPYYGQVFLGCCVVVALCTVQ